MPRKAKTVREKLAMAIRDGECFLWNGSTGRYGHINIKGKTHMAHRVAWETFVGPIPKGMFVCHTCDNARCIRVSHLFLGTHQDNMNDMKSKGRSAMGDRHGSRVHPSSRRRGAMHPNSKLSHALIISIAGEYLTGRYRQMDLAVKYGVHHRTIGRIVKGGIYGTYA